MYYIKMSIEETMKKAFTYSTSDKMPQNQHELDCFVQDNLNTKLPLDGPQWRVWFTKIKDHDGKDYTVQIWK